jgi:mRNA-degrading endonuclease toxin of MazEF toxin-antitoxin module
MPFPIVPKSAFTFRKRKEWGQLYWFDFGQSGSGQPAFDAHPALIISDPQNILPGTVLIVHLSGAEHKRAGYEFHVEITKKECPELDKDSIVKVDQIYCVENQFMPDQYFIGDVPRSTMKRIYSKLLKVLGFNKVIG